MLPWNPFIKEDATLHPLNIAEEPAPIGFFGQQRHILTVPLPDPNVPLSDLEEAAFVAAFGRLWSGQEEFYQTIIPLQHDKLFGINYYIRNQRSDHPYYSPINFTMKGLSPRSSPFNASPYLDVVIAQTIKDVCWFWNLRAESFARSLQQGREVIILSREQFLTPGIFEVVLQLLRERRIPPYLHSDVQVVFHHHDETVSELLEAQSGLSRWKGAIQIQVTLDEVSMLLSNPSPPGTIDTSISYGEGFIEYAGEYEEFAGEYQIVSVDLVGGPNTLLLPAPKPATSQTGMVSLGVQSATWERLLPHPEVARLVGKEATFERTDQMLQLNYPILLHPGTTKVTLTLPTTWDMYRAYFQAQGYEVDPSDKMAYANGLLERAGGLEQAEILRSRLAYHMLDSLADKQTKKLAQELRKQGLSDKSEEKLVEVLQAYELFAQYHRHPRSFEKIRSALGSKGPEDLRVLGELVRIQAVQRGLLITCPSCHTPVWYGIGVLDEQIKCLGCLTTFYLPLTEGSGDRKDRPLQFSLNPLANRAMDQDVVPVIASLLTFKTRHLTMAHVIPGMVVTKQGQANQLGDFDFISVHHARLYGGECKAGQILGDKDIKTARLAEALGFRAFFFATTATFNAESRQLIEAWSQIHTPRRWNLSQQVNDT